MNECGNCEKQMVVLYIFTPFTGKLKSKETPSPKQRFLRIIKILSRGLAIDKKVVDISQMTTEEE